MRLPSWSACRHFDRSVGRAGGATLVPTPAGRLAGPDPERLREVGPLGDVDGALESRELVAD